MSFVDTKNLFEWAFSNFSYQTVISSKEPIVEAKVRLAQDTDYVVLNTSRSVEACCRTISILPTLNGRLRYIMKMK